MRKLVFFGFLAIFYFFLQKPVWAESGCGGTEFCQSTKIVNEYQCNLYLGICQKEDNGTSTINCTVTETECYGYDRTVTGCTGGCFPITQGKKVSCCSGAGGGGYECAGESQLVRDCLPRSSCQDERRGGSCGGGRFWCFSLQCLDCTATVPVIPPITTTATTATISWTGTGGTEYRLYVCSNSSYTNCLVNANGTVSTSPTTVNVTSGTFYYVKVVNYKDAACSAEATSKFLSSCTVIPNPLRPMNPTDTQDVAVVINANSEIPVANFSSTNAVASVASTSNLTGLVTANSFGDTTIDANVVISGTTYSCTGSALTVQNNGPWWQVIDGDVVTNGSIGSDVPSPNYFDVDGAGGFPGVPIYGTSFNLSNTPELISTKMWNSNTLTSFSRRFDYNYFRNLLPSTTIPAAISNLGTGTTPDTNGYEWFSASGPTTINALNFRSRKVIIFVNGNLNINGNIAVDNGLGFVGIFASGSITLDPAVTSIEGLYLTDVNFITNTGSNQLRVRGSVASYGNVTLQRDLDDDSSPSEIFEFAPDQLMLFPQNLGYSRIKWSEVAP